MGLTALLRTNDQEVLNKLGAIINVWFNVLSEVQDSEGGEYPPLSPFQYPVLPLTFSPVSLPYIYCSALICWRSEEDDGGSDFGGSYASSPHDLRKRAFLQNDPVHTT